MAENFDKLKKNGTPRDTCQTLLSFFFIKEQMIIYLRLGTLKMSPSLLPCPAYAV
jgi:hypothetical protein